VLDLVGDVALAQKARLDLAVGHGKLGVEHLHGHAHPVSVRRRVHRRHPTYTDEIIELPLVFQRVPDALLGALDQRVVGLIHR